MNRPMQHPHRSEQGASFMLALLMMLVCIIISSMVITSSTAATGRLSSMAIMDQRAYSVRSAAELLVKQFVKASGNITVTCTRVETEDESGAIETTSINVSIVHPETATDPGLQMVVDLTKDMFGLSSETVELNAADIGFAAIQDAWATQSIVKPMTATYTVQLDGQPTTKVFVEATVNEHGDIVLDIYNDTSFYDTSNPYADGREFHQYILLAGDIQYVDDYADVGEVGADSYTSTTSAIVGWTVSEISTNKSLLSEGV